ncbi:MAG: hypothetical protein WD625_05845 [Balneolales bacterium]
MHYFAIIPSGNKVFIFLLPLLFLVSTCDDQVTGPGQDNGNGNDHDEVGQSAHLKGVGESANDLLSGETFETLIVQVQYMEGAEPTDAALDNLGSFLEERVHKASVELRVEGPIPSGGKEKYSISEIRDLEDEHRTEYIRADTIATYYLYVDGGSDQDSNGSHILGAAYRNTSMVMFHDNIDDVSGGLGKPSKRNVETTVLNHEFGHILGLVNTGSEMQADHKDEEQGAHCDNGSCLMHYTARTDGIEALIIGGSVPELDGNCIDDLQANGGK